ncbi:MAG TPA: hypothetical protein PL033_04405 [Candidatus Brocadiia bacterium]|nr:hypothetical protein [Candidatus Brocadiia bacterium]
MKQRRPLIGIIIAVALLTLGGCAERRETVSERGLDAMPKASIMVVPGEPDIGTDPPQWRVLALVRTDSDETVKTALSIECAAAKVLSVQPAEAENSRTRPVMFFAHLEATGNPAEAGAVFSLKGADAKPVKTALPIGVNLCALKWQSRWEGKDSRLADVRGAPGGGGEWKEAMLPRIWQDLGITWVRTFFVIPASWRDLDLRLEMGAVDDNEATFLNGVEIGRTNGWDVRRNYKLPPEAVKWGQANEIAVAVENVNAGGGIYRIPICITAGGAAPTVSPFEQAKLAKEGDRRIAGALGNPAPLRRMIVRDGVLYYADGGEVALWGVNYYPQSWSQFESLRRRGVDHCRSTDEDFEDFADAGIQIIRIHVFDTEISDGEGNLIRNKHLDVLDYLVSKCNKKGIYLMLTPIAWWWSPNARPDSFSRNTPKEAMALWPERRPVQANYLKQFLSHENPYTGRRLVDEPCLALFEIINEPVYWTYGDVTSRSPGNTGLSDEISLAALDGVRAAWHRFAPSEEWRTPAVFACFRYDSLRSYINEMIVAVRSTGATQPIASSTFDSSDTDIVQAVADSDCEAITFGAYPGGLTEITDDKNLLSQLGNAPMDSRYERKARLVYEFDAPGTITRVSMYPALARHWRNRGVQVACQFQYDARSLAHINPDWNIHYLNLWHTPEKMVSFLIGGEVFRRIPRGAEFQNPEDDQIFAPGAASFRHNAALLCAEDAYMRARATDWEPLPAPDNPSHIMTVGSCRYYEYEGSGVVDLKIEGDAALLRIYPDVERLKYALQGTPEEPLTRLHENAHSFKLLLPGWEGAKVEKWEDGAWKTVDTGVGFAPTPGRYRLNMKSYGRM